MSQVKAKQLKLAAAGDLLIGGNNGSGTTLSIGTTGHVLRVVDSAPKWEVNNNLTSADGGTSITATDTTINFVSDAKNVATFGATATADSVLSLTADVGKLTLAAAGDAADVDVVIAPKGEGEVIIGTSGGGVIQADDGFDLKLMGGAGAGNLLLAGGGTGKVYYAGDASDPLKEVATKGDIDSAVGAATVSQTRTEYAGNATSFALDTKAILTSVIAYINGLVVKDDFFAVDPATKVVTFSGLPYTLDDLDQVVFTYEITAQ